MNKEKPRTVDAGLFLIPWEEDVVEPGYRGGAAVVVWGDPATGEMLYLPPQCREVRQPNGVALGVGVRRFVFLGPFVVHDPERQFHIYELGDVDVQRVHISPSEFALRFADLLEGDALGVNGDGGADHRALLELQILPEVDDKHSN